MCAGSVTKFTERFEDESALVETRMRENEIWCFDHTIIVKKEIEIDGPGTEADGRSFAEGPLDALELSKHFFGCEVRVECPDGVEEVRLIFEIARRCLVHGGEADPVECQTQRCRSLSKMPLRVNVRAKADEGTCYDRVMVRLTDRAPGRANFFTVTVTKAGLYFRRTRRATSSASRSMVLRSFPASARRRSSARSK